MCCIITCFYFILQVFSLLRGEVLEDCSILITCLPRQVTQLSPLCDRRLINLGLDCTRQEQFITRYVLLNRGKGEMANWWTFGKDVGLLPSSKLGSTVDFIFFGKYFTLKGQHILLLLIAKHHFRTKLMLGTTLSIWSSLYGGWEGIGWLWTIRKPEA